MLSKFQLTNVTGIEFTEAVSVTGMNLARRLRSILIEIMNIDEVCGRCHCTLQQ